MALRFEFLDVGQGDSTLVEFDPIGTGELWLVDFGKKSQSDVSIIAATEWLVQRITEVCKARKETYPNLDKLIITHPDGDHWNRLGYLIKGDDGKGGNLWEQAGWKAGTELVTTDLIFGGAWSTYLSRNRDLAKLVDSIAANTTEFPRNYSRKTPRWKVGGTNVYVLSANRGNGGDANPDSVVLMFEHKGYKVILPGDAESHVVEPAILGTYTTTFLKSFMLKLGHHGSKASSSQEWLDVIQPSAAIATGDKRWRHPYAEPFDRARKYLATNLPLHRFCASGGARLDTFSGDVKYYQNQNTQRGAFTNLWYVVKEDKIKLKGPDDNGDIVMQSYEEGLFLGVQWTFDILDNGTAAMNPTPQWPSPVNQNVWIVRGAE